MDSRSRGQFLWEYYKIPIAAVVFAVFLVVLTVLTTSKTGKQAMYAVFLNSVPSSGNQLELDRLLEDGGIEMDGRHVEVTANLQLGIAQGESTDAQTMQILTALFGTNGLDFFAADAESFARYASLGAMADLSVHLDSSVLEAHSADLCWFDIPNGTRVLAGIVLHPGSPLHQAGYYVDDVVVGIAANPKNSQEAICFLKQLL